MDKDAQGLNLALALLGEVERLMEAKHEGTDLYKQAVANVLHIAVEDVTAEQRQFTKVVSFGARMGFGGVSTMEKGNGNDRILKAVAFAERAYRGRYRRPVENGVPYVTHPIAVARLAARCGADVSVIVACLLHDVIEETDKPAEMAQAVEREFGVVMAETVKQLTDDAAASSEEKHEAQCTKDYNLVAAFVKIADKACNVREYYESPLTDRAFVEARSRYKVRAVAVVQYAYRCADERLAMWGMSGNNQRRLVLYQLINEFEAACGLTGAYDIAVVEEG